LYLINISTTVYRYILWLVHVQKSLSQKSFAIASREPPVRWIQSPCGHLQIAISLCLKLGRPVASGYGQNILRITHGIPWVNGLSMFIHVYPLKNGRVPFFLHGYCLQCWFRMMCQVCCFLRMETIANKNLSFNGRVSEGHLVLVV
jgi:hypothetical protein